MRQNEKKFGLDQKVEFKKSCELNCQISVKVITKVAEFMSILHWMNKS